MSLSIVSELPVKPVIRQTKPNEHIHLGNHKVRLEIDGKEYEDTAAVFQRFGTSTSLRIICPFKDEGPFFALRIGNKGEMYKMHFVDLNASIDVFFSASGADIEGIAFTPRYSEVRLFGSTDKIKYAIFHLFNFPEFYCNDDIIIERESNGTRNSRRISHTILLAETWKISIYGLEESDSMRKLLSADGGHVITNVGKIENVSGESFSSQDIDNLQFTLHYFLSFMLGRWCGPSYTTGYDFDENVVYQNWGLKTNSAGPWQQSKSIFVWQEGLMLAEVFQGFYELCKSDVWNKPLRHAIYWYIESNRSNLDTSIIISQTALELLAWNYCVIIRKMVSQSAFKPRGLTAPDKLRLLATGLGIPNEIPSHLVDVVAHAKKQNWDDIMDATVKVRNSLVHPDAKHDFDDVFLEIMNLSLWFIELVILKLCNFNSTYFNRVGENMSSRIRQVPWATS